MALWRTTDTGAHWTRYSPVLAAGSRCLFSFAPDDPRRMTVQVELGGQNTQPCAHDSFYLSSDGGATWRKLPPHVSIAPNSISGNGWCDLHVTQRHLFLAYSYEPAQSPQVSLLERSDDDGVSWKRADRGLGAGALFFMPQVGPGDTLAVTVVHIPAHPVPAATDEPARLWTSTDAGETWRQTSILPDGVGTFLLTARPISGEAWPTVDHPFYALMHEQIPEDLYRARAVMSADSQHWTLLPPLPVSGVSGERRGILQFLSALPDGRIAVWCSSPLHGLPAADMVHEPMTAFWLWLWDPMGQQWQALSSPLNVTAGSSRGLCWQAWSAVGRDGATYLYIYRFDLGASDGTPPGIFRVRLP